MLLPVLKKCLKLIKSSHWTSHRFTNVKKYHQYALAGLYLDIHRNEVDALQRDVAIDETWVRVCESELKCQSYEWCQPCSPLPKKIQ
ncbi:hypothetical protein NPIL_401051 [Nephila pilipes]|uniref:Uncharacterized protein n=1 Tax=Nephila pilipes TaxID=299642 RepID=A0A8X6Q3Y9_NEPPI|nr:hypothetical protein NPIL_401051 [Nephila pilipes]